MKSNRNRTYLMIIALLMLSGALILVAYNTATPGFCPTYPVLNQPACVIVSIYFAGMLGALSMTGAVSVWLFYACTTLALFTGLGFSAFELTTDGHQCPQLWGIPVPLCFTVPPMMLLALFLGNDGRKESLPD
ncbi:MAG: hypothetical protein GKR98_03990 [Boseongicola sp.]|nr:MAG: hypothetical protein GKR98_03990 [Boseongicola sp.]